MTARTQRTLDILATLLVLFTALLDPRISVGLAIALLVALFLLRRSEMTAKTLLALVSAMGIAFLIALRLSTFIRHT